LRSERTFVERGKPLEIELIVTDLDGNPIADRLIQVTAARLEWKYRGSDWREEEVDVQECSVGSQTEPVSCTFETPLGGRYRITAFVSDNQGRRNMSRFERWVSGGELPPSRKVEQEDLTLIPDKESYQPGETAEILVQAPFSPAEGLLTVSRSGILYSERFSIQDGSATLLIPIEEAHIPNLNIQVDVVGSAPRTDDQGEALEDVPRRPAYASGQLKLSIPALGRTLALELTPGATELEPGGETTIGILLRDAQGNPVSGAELAVVVVDEAILALSSYQIPDPIGVFYSDRMTFLYSTYGRASIVLVDPQALIQAGEAQLLNREVVEEAMVEGEMRALATPALPMQAPAADMGMVQAQPEPIRVRTDFNPLAVFSPEVHTNADGEASVEVKLPDNLTRYRIMVVAVDAGGRQFGSAEANLTARLPLMVRPSAPRFLNFGDSIELPVVLQNQTDEPLVTEVVIQTRNLKLTGASGMRVTIPANDRVEIRFPATTEMAGTARFQVAAVSGNYADAAEVELPVYTPATTEAFAVYGVVDEGAVLQPVPHPATCSHSSAGWRSAPRPPRCRHSPMRYSTWCRIPSSAASNSPRASWQFLHCGGADRLQGRGATLTG
jgi:alpha-2-macroglobulin